MVPVTVEVPIAMVNPAPVAPPVNVPTLVMLGCAAVESVPPNVVAFNVFATVAVVPDSVMMESPNVVAAVNFANFPVVPLMLDPVANGDPLKYTAAPSGEYNVLVTTAGVAAENLTPAVGSDAPPNDIAVETVSVDADLGAGFWAIYVNLTSCTFHA